MQFDPENRVVKLCAEGMACEGEGRPDEAAELFRQAWVSATTHLEQFTAAHYVARQQASIADKLHWDEIALAAALKADDEGMKGTYPSLYLNIGKCYEDLNDRDNALKNYQLASSFASHLPDDGYGSMIMKGIVAGLERVSL